MIKPKTLTALCVCFVAWTSGFHLQAQSGIYDRVGIVPGHGAFGSLPEENIDLFTGNVTLRYRDVFLPGPEGLNVEVWRVYNSKILKDRQSGNPVVQAYHKSWVGIGWTMHMGMVHQETSSTPIIEFPDGRLEIAFLDKNDANNRYLTRDFLRYDKVSHKLYFQNGVIWTFGATTTITRADGTSDPVRLVTKIENSFGYSIIVAYNSGTPTLSAITDSYGRVVTFTSTTTNPRKLISITLKDATGNNKVINYSVGTFANGYYKLTSFHAPDPDLASTTFEYNSGSSNDYELKKVTTGYGGVLEYSYADHIFFFNAVQLNSRVLLQKKITFNPGEQACVWNFNYPAYNGVTSGTASVQGPLYDSSITYNAYDPAYPWKIGTLSALEYPDGSYAESTDWSFQEISDQTWNVLGINMGTAKGPLVSSVTRHKSGGARLKEEFLYEISQYKRYGLPSKALQYVNGGSSRLNYRTISYYFTAKPSYEDRYLLALPSSESEFRGDGTKLKEHLISYYEETGKWGATQKIRVWKEGSSYADWNQYYFPPDQWMRIQTEVVGPDGYTTWKNFRYGIEEQSKTGDITTITRMPSEYDSSVSREILQDGAVLFYSYDQLGRVTLVDWPTDRYDEATTWYDTQNKSVTTRGDAQIGYHTVTRYWDGMGRDKVYKEEGDGTALYYYRTLDAEGRLVSECKGSTSENHKYLYTYNAAGEVTQITDPTGHVTHITLNDVTKTVLDPQDHATTFEYEHLPGLPTSVTDAQGHEAVYGYDALGRLVSVDYNNGARTHSFEYDRNDNLTAETHPETGRIAYTYSDTNWLTRKTWGGAVTTYSHNLYDGNLYLVTSGDGATTEEEIDYVYGTTGRRTRVRSLKKGWKREGITYDPYGNVTNETITIPVMGSKAVSYDYDKLGNLQKTTYPDSHWSKANPNSLGMPENLAFDSTSNYIVSSAAYGHGKAVTNLAFARNGTAFSASYFASGEPSQAALTKNGVMLYDASYQYNGNGNILSISSATPAPALSSTFGYDSLNRLTSAAYNSGRVNSFAYAYDEYGNMRTVQENGVTVFNKYYDSGNRFAGGVYDARGNLLLDQGAIYLWNKQNQLSYVTNTAGEILGKYLYDERGLRLMALPPLPEADIYMGSPETEVIDGTRITLQCPVGQYVDTTFTIRNHGDANLELTGSPKVAITGTNADQYSVLTQPSSPIAPAAATSFVVRFSPTSTGKKTAAIAISNNDLNENPYDIPLTGNLNPPEIQVVDVLDGGSWDFGTVRVGQSQQWPFMIQSLGEADLLLNGSPRVQITGDEQGQFFVEQQPNGVVSGGGATFFIIRFSPTSEGPATAQVSIQNNDSDENPFNFTLTGTGQGNFMLSADDPELDITVPDGNEKLVAGQTQTIAWTGGGTTQFVRLEYSSDNGSTYTTIAEREPNTGRFDWIVPTEYSSVCLIRVSDADGLPASPQGYVLQFDLKVGLYSEATAAGSQFGIRVAIPDALKQITRAADFMVSSGGQSSTEKAALNLSEANDLSLGLASGEWRHFQLTLDLDKSIGSVAIDGKVMFEDIPLTQSPVSSDRPELVILPNAGSLGKIWLDNLEVRYQDHCQIVRTGEPAKTDRPIISDPFDRYDAGTFPQQGGWKHGRTASTEDAGADMAGVTEATTADSGVVQSGEISKQAYDQGITAQAGTAALIDEGERLSPLRSLRFKQASTVFPIVKSFALPSRLPYDVSRAGFTIVAKDTELADLMDKMIEERTQSSEVGAVLDISQTIHSGLVAVTSQGVSGSVSAMTTLLVPRTGSCYIYSFDGRLLAEYDIYGACLRDYIYMGSRLVAEYVPATGQYFYYTQDQIGSTRVVTNDSGTVVYAEAHDPYGGIQKTWVNTFDPKRKFSDKERDAETGLDYFGARYFSAPVRWGDGHTSGNYRWLSLDPVLNTDRAISEPQRWNLYAFCRSNPTSYVDPDGRSILPTLGIRVAISDLTSFIIPWMAFKLALQAQFSLWGGTPWAETAEDVTRGVNGRADCGGLTHGIYRDAGYDYPWKGPNLKFPETNFDLAVKKGGALEGFFRQLEPNERKLFGDIVLWNGKHIAIYAGLVNGQDMIFTTTSAGAKPQEMRWYNKESTPTGFYRWLFH